MGDPIPRVRETLETVAADLRRERERLAAATKEDRPGESPPPPEQTE